MTYILHKMELSITEVIKKYNIKIIDYQLNLTIDDCQIRVSKYYIDALDFIYLSAIKHSNTQPLPSGNRTAFYDLIIANILNNIAIN